MPIRSPNASVQSVPSSSRSMHTSVLLESSIDALALAPGDIVIDGTFGGGGHTRLILAKEQDVSVVCVDLDEAAQRRFAEQFRGEKRAQFVHDNFAHAAAILAAAGKALATKVLLDLGTSTFQLLADERGFSFNSDAPLAMTFSATHSRTGFTASDMVNTWQAETLADIIFYYGGERRARRIASAIVEARERGPIQTSSALADIIAGVSPRRSRIHPATKTFQALRIAVNDELAVLEEALSAWWERLAPGGRIAVITFHSLEDRIVKRWIQSKSQDTPDALRVITKKPIVPSRKELTDNPRSRSAKLRVVEKTSYSILL